MPLSDNMRGAVLMMISMAGFTLNDAVFKTVAGEVPLFQAVFVRGVMVSALLFLLAYYKGAFKVRVARRDWKITALRSFGELGATVCFLTALFNMPLANVTSILQSLPLAITLAGAVFLGEKVGWRRYGAILFGFFGVMLIVRPGGEGFSAYSLYALAAVGFVVIRDLSTRRLSTSVPSLSVAFAGAVTIMLMGGAVSATQEWVPMSGTHYLTMALATVFLIAAYLFSVMVMRVGDIAFISPFRYTAILWAIVLGVLIFGDVPDLWTLCGAGVVASTGIYTFYRERRQEKAT